MEVTTDFVNKARAFAENAANRVMENTRDLGLPGDSGAQYFDTSEEKMRNIKRQLDSKNDREKLDGLKRLIAMISKGRDVSEFFADVVKNVVSQNIEVRKLVYIYLLRYAEQEPDLALLSINSFQKDLSDKNHIIRAMALRVMSGIRVPVISPIVLLGIKKCVTDSNQYVRKTAAHAIPKCFSLDSSQKDSLVEILATLLKDRSSITVGSTIMAFNEICPNRFDLIHPCFRRLCHILSDCDEWGQMTILGVMLRYGRSQFLNPNPPGEDQSKIPTSKHTTINTKTFYSDSDSQDEKIEKKEVVELDEDHELLLKSCIPLLQSRNSGVVLAVAKLLYHLAPTAEAQRMAKPLTRILRQHRELQYVVLTNIVTMSAKRPYLFELFLSQFFPQSTEPAFIRDAKLNILTNIANDANIHTLLNEFQQYVKSTSKSFVAAAVQAIARCATTVPASADRCLRLLMKLLRSTNELVVAESVIVVTRLLQHKAEERKKSVISLAKLLESIKMPVARANILWLIGQHAETLPTVGPDVLRQAAMNFKEESDATKLQILTLSAKLVCLNPENTRLDQINQYILNMGRYDLSLDVRDRTRFLKALTVRGGDETHFILKDHLKKILLASKEPQTIENGVENKSQFTIGSLSLLANQELPDYEPLPDYPEEQPDPSTRDVEELEGWSGSRTMNERGFGNGPSTAVSSIEAFGSSSYSTPVAKKKGREYDLDAFYDDDDDDGDSSVEDVTDTTSSEDDETDDDESEEEGEEEEESESVNEETEEEEEKVGREDSVESEDEEGNSEVDERAKLVTK